jgi:hypothetical protein
VVSVNHLSTWGALLSTGFQFSSLDHEEKLIFPGDHQLHLAIISKGIDSSRYLHFT